ncbi:hypothetical protein [Micromonospora sp. NPDC005367]|uniref:hypothetical protein n=1 Tax=Micromonospora sp. NPDC005367 TaxID=3155590 RepID=UPI0033A15D25
MIPTLMLFGLVLGRWWRLSLIAAAAGWPILLVASDVVNIELALLTASGLAVSNTGLGVLVHQGVLWVVRNHRRSRSSQSSA